MRPQVDERVEIARPVAEVFGYYRDMRHDPDFLGDVLAVDPRPDGTFRWTVALPLGIRMRWTVFVTADVPERRFAFRAGTRRFTTARWDVRFTDLGDRTRVEERMAYPGGRAALLVLAVVGKHPATEVRSNLHRLRQVMEDGRATDDADTMGKRFGGGGAGRGRA